MPKNNSRGQKKFSVTVEKMRRIEALTVSRYGISIIILMENAGLACVEVLLKQKHAAARTVLVLCGAGNNGGDGFVIARHLFCRGVKVQIFHFASSKPPSPEARVNYEAARKLKIPYQKNPSAVTVQKALRQSGWAVDALFGIGFARPLEGKILQTVEILNRARNPVLSVDIPSGLDADTGRVLGEAVEADVTVTFGALKKAFLLKKSKKITGRVILKKICFPPELLR